MNFETAHAISQLGAGAPRLLAKVVDLLCPPKMPTAEELTNEELRLESERERFESEADELNEDR